MTPGTCPFSPTAPGWRRRVSVDDQSMPPPLTAAAGIRQRPSLNDLVEGGHNPDEMSAGWAVHDVDSLFQEIPGVRGDELQTVRTAVGAEQRPSRNSRKVTPLV